MGLCKGQSRSWNAFMFDTFISYRRQGGSDYAPRVCDYLEERGYRPFYDHIGMENERFDEQIRRNLINAINFVLFFPRGRLIAHAMKATG